MAGFSHHVVCSPLTLASEIGRDVLRDGGNAADAAVATGLTLAVAYPHMCGVGGDALAMVWAAGRLVGLDSGGALPAAAQLPPAGVPQHGIGSATVPGAPAAWTALLERFGTRPLAALAAPAIRLARSGLERSPGLARMSAWFRPLLERDAEARRIFLADGPLVQAELAVTLERLDEFYEGPVAARAPAPFTPADFAVHRARWVEPRRLAWEGLTVCELPPPSRGYLALEALARLEPLTGLDPGSAEFHRRLIAVAPAAPRAADTIYLCAVDAAGMAVSLSQSLFHAFGSGVVVPGTGVLLHNRGAYHTRATYRGGARPVHTLAPAMALRDERPHLVFGTMGGDAQVQIHLQLLARIVVAGQPVADAVAAPRWTHDGAQVLVESGLPPLGPLPDGLVATPMPLPDLAGHAHVVRLQDGARESACDPRSDGVPVGD